MSLKITTSPTAPPAKQFEEAWLRLSKEAVKDVGRDVLTVLRQQTKGRFKSTRLPRTWRQEVYPPRDRLAYNPATLIYSKVPKIIDAHERGTPYGPVHKRFMAIPLDPETVSFTRNELISSARGVERLIWRRKQVEVNKTRLVQARYTPELLAARGWQFKAVRLASGALILFGAARQTTPAAKSSNTLSKKGFAPKRGKTDNAVWIPMFWLVKMVGFRKTFDLPNLANKAQLALLLKFTKVP